MLGFALYLFSSVFPKKYRIIPNRFSIQFGLSLLLSDDLSSCINHNFKNKSIIQLVIGRVFKSRVSGFGSGLLVMGSSCVQTISCIDFWSQKSDFRDPVHHQYAPCKYVGTREDVRNLRLVQPTLNKKFFCDIFWSIL